MLCHTVPRALGLGHLSTDQVGQWPPVTWSLLASIASGHCLAPLGGEPVFLKAAVGFSRGGVSISPWPRRTPILGLPTPKRCAPCPAPCRSMSVSISSFSPYFCPILALFRLFLQAPDSTPPKPVRFNEAQPFEMYQIFAQGSVGRRVTDRLTDIAECQKRRF